MDYKQKYLKYKIKYCLIKSKYYLINDDVYLFYKNYNDIIKIKNKVSMTIDNIYYFSNKSKVDKRYLYKFAKKYNHEELEILLRISVN